MTRPTKRPRPARAPLGAPSALHPDEEQVCRMIAEIAARLTSEERPRADEHE